MLFIESVDLWQFRNYAHLAWQGLNQYNLLMGKNGQGKSNLLEALYFLSHGRSHRSHRDHELVRHAQGGSLDATEEDPFLGQGSRVVLQLQQASKLEARFLTDSVISAQGNPYKKWKTQFLLDDQPCKSRSEILGRLPSVSFYLSDLDIVRGTPQDRRRWIDLATMQRDPFHLEHLQKWKHCLSEKNALLKQMAFPSPTPSTLDLMAVLNMQLATLAYPILSSRLQTLKLLQNTLPTLYTLLSQGQDGIPVLTYQVHHWPEALEGLETLAQADWIHACQTRLQTLLPQELRRQSTTWGIHRDDIELHFHQGKQRISIPTYASQGQQRSVVIALKLAEIALLEDCLPHPPVILLDDIMAELDAQRQAQVLQLFPKSSQVFLTTPYLNVKDHFQGLLNEQAQQLSTWTIEEGRIISS
jgi:DNA replication and repair protein RecF